jgi:hypothetical protein
MRLGRWACRIVAETFVGLLDGDPDTAFSAQSDVGVRSGPCGPVLKARMLASPSLTS